ncbi:hypothetical protein [Dubosiella newyorkensis]|uniref:hypothetical protein n=2 Tax=Dubosiella newyorkensis TaxID=1862672 RepID=UPI00272EA25F|nr:hypothetical protein [Dubosiella newyorkensis]
MEFLILPFEKKKVETGSRLSTWKDPTFDKALEEPIAIVYKIQNFEKFLFLSFTINSIIKEIKKGKDTIESVKYFV